MKIKLGELKQIIREELLKEEWEQIGSRYVNVPGGGSKEETAVAETANGTTVEDFFTWYTGPRWDKDSQTTNSMVVDGEHAQDHRRGEMYWLTFLAQNSNTPITVTTSDTQLDTYNNVFTIEDHQFSVDSLDPYTQG